MPPYRPNTAPFFCRCRQASDRFAAMLDQTWRPPAQRTQKQSMIIYGPFDCCDNQTLLSFDLIYEIVQSEYESKSFLLCFLNITDYNFYNNEKNNLVCFGIFASYSKTSVTCQLCYNV